jgi:integrase
LRELHSYLCALHGKAPLSDEKLLAPLPVLDHTDANILTIEEYRQLLSTIELRWPLDEDFERRRIARLMVILGFRAGLRREECRLLRVNDLILRGRKQLWVRPSKGHTLKSDHSLRRVEIWRLLSKEELEELERWITGRKLSGSDFLFKTSVLDVVPQSIFETINDFMKELIGGSTLGGHFHHCRHSLASHCAIKLLVGEGCDIQRLLTGKVGTPHPGTAGQMHMNSLRKRKGFFLLARLLGHCHPATTVRYSHVFGPLLRYFIRRSPLMQPDLMLPPLALGNSRKGFDHHLNETAAIASAVQILGARKDFRYLGSAEGHTSAHAGLVP